jgi:hypothetical protein
MTATLVPLEIVCPAWCSVVPEEHVRGLWDNAGNCLHLSADVPVEDPTGFQEPLEAPRFNPPVRLTISSCTSPENRESASPVLFLDDREHTIGQALAVADAIRELVEVYRAAGGVE